MTSEFTPEQTAVIEDIAFRTNILALNAAMEAAGVLEAAGSEVGEGKSDRV